MTIYHIIDNIYLSNLDSALELNKYNPDNINIIIRLSEDNNKNIYNNIEFFNFELEDNHLYTYELLRYSNQINNIIEKNKDKKILIHCNEGKSRSVSIISLYLIIKKKFTYQDAMVYIMNIKPDININYGFINILMLVSNIYNNSEYLEDNKYNLLNDLKKKRIFKI